MIENLHFVRPEWFYAFIPLIALIVMLYRRHGNSMNWKSVCDDKLLPYILSPSTDKSSRLPLVLAALAAAISIIAAAGPAFEKLPKPVYREQSTLVILMDLSQSMDASDIKPTRLERAKLKLLDILDSRKAGQTALIVYAADAFVVTPITDDSNTIASLVPTLQTGLMPSQGSHAYIAIEKSIELLQQAGVAQGDVLLVTDDITDRDLGAIKNLVSNSYRLSVLGVGTEDGSPVSLNGGFLQDSSGAIVIPKLDPQKLQHAALNGGGLYVTLGANDADLNTLNKLFSSRKSQQDQASEGMELTADIWQEEGPWLLLLIIPLVALWSRKGWLLCFTFFVLPVPEQAHALDMDHLWSNPDQKAMRAFKDGKADEAAQQFNNDDWKAAAHYRAGNYDQALETLQNPSTSDGFYNKGNALAQTGRYQEAIEAYDEALKLNANNKDASFNREQVEQALQQQQQQSEDGNDGQQGEDSDQNKEGESEQQQGSDSENKEQSDSQQSESQQQDSKQQNESEQANEQSQSQSGDEAQKEEQDKEEVEQALKDAQQKDSNDKQDAKEQSENNKQEAQQSSQLEETELSEDEQAVEQWLKRVPDNPDLLLRRKFLYQYKNMERKTPSDQSW